MRNKKGEIGTIVMMALLVLVSVIGFGSSNFLAKKQTVNTQAAVPTPVCSATVGCGSGWAYACTLENGCVLTGGRCSTKPNLEFDCCVANALNDSSESGKDSAQIVGPYGCLGQPCYKTIVSSTAVGHLVGCTNTFVSGQRSIIDDSHNYVVGPVPSTSPIPPSGTISGAPIPTTGAGTPTPTGIYYKVKDLSTRDIAVESAYLRGTIETNDPYYTKSFYRFHWVDKDNFLNTPTRETISGLIQSHEKYLDGDKDLAPYKWKLCVYNSDDVEVTCSTEQTLVFSLGPTSTPTRTPTPDPSSIPSTPTITPTRTPTPIAIRGATTTPFPTVGSGSATRSATTCSADSNVINFGSNCSSINFIDPAGGSNAQCSINEVIYSINNCFVYRICGTSDGVACQYVCFEDNLKKNCEGVTDPDINYDAIYIVNNTSEAIYLKAIWFNLGSIEKFVKDINIAINPYMSYSIDLNIVGMWCSTWDPANVQARIYYSKDSNISTDFNSYNQLMQKDNCHGGVKILFNITD